MKLAICYILLGIMPTIRIVDTGGGADPGNLYFAAYNNDFNYSIFRGSIRWLCLWKYNPSIVTSFEGTAMFKSTDGGATWVLTDDADAPELSVGLPVPLAYDSRFNILDATGQSKMTALYASFPETVIAFTSVTSHLHMIDFTFGVDTYGAPYGDLDITNTFPHSVIGTFSFSSLPSGNRIVVYNKNDGAGTVAYQMYSGSWGGEQVLTAAAGNLFTNLAVDSSGNSHIIVRDGSFNKNYYRINSSGTVVAGPQNIITGGTPGNLSIIDGQLVYLVADDSGTSFTVLTGSPPVWTSETISGVDTNNSQNTAWLQKLGGAYNVNLEISGSGPDYDYTVDFAEASVSGYTVHWVNSTKSNIYRVVKSGTWGSPTSLWTPAPPTVGHVFSIVVRGATAFSGNRYRVFYQ